MKQVFPSSFLFFMRVTEYFAHADGRFLTMRGFLKQRIGQIRGALTQQQNNGRAPTSICVTGPNAAVFMTVYSRQFRIKTGMRESAMGRTVCS